MSNVLFFEERNSLTLVNKSLDLGREMENIRGRETKNKKKRRWKTKKITRISIPIWISYICKIVKINKFL